MNARDAANGAPNSPIFVRVIRSEVRQECRKTQRAVARNDRQTVRPIQHVGSTQRVPVYRAGLNSSTIIGTFHLSVLDRASRRSARCRRHSREIRSSSRAWDERPAMPLVLRSMQRFDSGETGNRMARGPRRVKGQSLRTA
jgi:hypothetical protein